MILLIDWYRNGTYPLYLIELYNGHVKHAAYEYAGSYYSAANSATLIEWMLDKVIR